jgi:hypothetical protein
MNAPDDRRALARSLAQLMERLCAPDLTLAEASELRPRLGTLMAQAEAASRVEPGRVVRCPAAP